MFPRDLKSESFDGYPPEARKLALGSLSVFRQLPLSFLPNVLRELIEYDFKFPEERKAVEKELGNLSSLSPEQITLWFGEFAQIHLSPQLEKTDWVNDPAQFVEQLSAYLWSSHQLDAFRKAAIAYGDRLRQRVLPEPPAIPRLGIAVVGQGVSSYAEPLFRMLRPHGVYFNRINPESGLKSLLNAIAARAKAHPLPYAHWYVDGGQTSFQDSFLTCVSYSALEPQRTALLRKMKAEVEKPGMGPETLRSFLARMRPEDLGFSKEADPIMNHFQLKILTEGSGTQIFGTSFVQWTAREALRRAQPLTLLVRFTPRQRERPMNELLSGQTIQSEPDAIGSLVDADMGAYYNWINQRRLTGNEQSSFLAWFENHTQAVALGPSMPHGTESDTAATIAQLLSWIV